ncbi:MAG: FIG00996837: hypothetical protein, partial [uncultured Actinomycetospora sp.]
VRPLQPGEGPGHPRRGVRRPRRHRRGVARARAQRRAHDDGARGGRPAPARRGRQGRPAAARAQPAGDALGPGARLGRRPQGRQPHDQRTRRLADRQARLPPRGEGAALPAPRRRVVRVAARRARRAQGAVLHHAARRALDRLRGAVGDLAPEGRAPGHGPADQHHGGHGRRRRPAHGDPPPDAAGAAGRALAGLARPRQRRPHRPARASAARAADLARAAPGVHQGQQRGQPRAGAARGDPRRARAGRPRPRSGRRRTCHPV